MGMEKNIIDVAAGRVPADKVLKNANYIDVFSCKIARGDIAVCGGKIAGVGSYSGEDELDCSRLFVLPGLIDGHVHIESSMLSVEEYARLALMHGVTAVICDPHEICNVCGDKGLEYMLAAAQNTPLDALFTVPSCVPSTDFETSGAELDADGVKSHISRGQFIALGEFMNYPAVVAGDKNALAKIAAALSAGKVCDGHAPNLSGNELNAYISAGISTDHECSTAEEAAEKVSKGMYVHIRRGSSERNLDVAKAVTKENFRRFLTCSDDRHADDLLYGGHIDGELKKLVQAGIDPAVAVCMATLNAAECYNLGKVGAIAPGYAADLAIVKDISSFEVKYVFKRGNLVAKDGKCLYTPIKTASDGVRGTVKVKRLAADDFKLDISGKVRAIRFFEGSIVTECKPVTIESRGGNAVLKDGLLKLAVCERHGKNGNISLGFVADYGFSGGAIATTVAHDSHNLMILGDDDGAMAKAGNALTNCGGGLALVRGDDVLVLPLPIAGLMTDLPYEEFIPRFKKILSAAREMGVKECYDPFLTFAFAALPVIPSLRLTDKGLFDVDKFEPVTIKID